MKPVAEAQVELRLTIGTPCRLVEKGERGPTYCCGANVKSSRAGEVEVHFCAPRSPWQRGSNENTNRLLHLNLPHGTDLSVQSQAQLNAIARQLNERPRKTLLYRTPAETFAECVAAIR